MSAGAAGPGRTGGAERGVRAWALLHGFTGSPASWDDVCERLEPVGTAFRPPLVGHGAGTGAAGDFVGEVDRLAAAVRSRFARPVHLCGYSLGARVALGLLVRHPALFCAATLIGVHPGLPAADPARAERAASDERWAMLAQSEPRRFVAEWAAQPIFATQSELSEGARARRDRIRDAHDFAALAGAMRALSLAAMPDWNPFLPALPMPVHLVAGERDAKFVALARAMLPRIPRARLTIVPGAGHNVPLERPSAVAAMLLG